MCGIINREEEDTGSSLMVGVWMLGLRSVKLIGFGVVSFDLEYGVKSGGLGV